MQREASVGGILAELVSLVADSARALALYTLVIGGVTAIGVVTGWGETTASSFDYGFSIDSSDTPASALFDLVSWILSVFGTYLLLRRFLAARGRLRADGGRFWTYFGMAVLSVIALVFGLVLVIVPGIILLVRWSAASGFAIGSAEGVTGSLGASWRATSGHGWAIFLAAVILCVGILACAGVASAVLAGVGVGDLVFAFIEAAAGAIFAAFGIAVYCVVQDEHHEISEVFA